MSMMGATPILSAGSAACAAVPGPRMDSSKQSSAVLKSNFMSVVPLWWVKKKRSELRRRSLERVVVTVPMQKTGPEQQEQLVHRVAGDGQHHDPRVHFPHPERALRIDDREAEPAVGADQLGDDHEDEADSQADMHAGEDLRQR